MSLDFRQFRALIIRPVITKMGMHSENAEELLLGTAIQESELCFLRQRPDGPALGVYQVEPDTMKDLYDNYLSFRPEVKQLVDRDSIGFQDPNELIWNLNYATAICRAIYRRFPEPIPDSLEGRAAYWKKYWNTEQGAGTVEQFIHNYKTITGG